MTSCSTEGSASETPTPSDEGDSSGLCREADDPLIRRNNGLNPALPGSRVDIAWACADRDACPELVDWLESHTEKAIAQLNIQQADLSIALVDDKQMCDIHEQYLGDNSTTDVVTFSLLEDDEQSPRATDDPDSIDRIDGELIVCVDEAQRQAEQRGIELKHELLLYIVHGLLHLMGLDDADAEEAAAMHQREDEILQAMGIGLVYARQEENKHTSSRSRLADAESAD